MATTVTIPDTTSQGNLAYSTQLTSGVSTGIDTNFGVNTSVGFNIGTTFVVGMAIGAILIIMAIKYKLV